MQTYEQPHYLIVKDGYGNETTIEYRNSDEHITAWELVRECFPRGTRVYTKIWVPADAMAEGHYLTMHHHRLGAK